MALCDLDESETYLHLNLPRKALALAQKAAESCGKAGLSYERAKALTFAGVAQTQDRRFPEALRAFETARAMFVRERNVYWAASVDLFRAQVLLRTNRAPEARRLAAGAKKEFESLNAPSKVAMSLVLMTRADLAMDRDERARTSADEIVRLIERNKIPLHLFPSYSVCGQVEEKLGHPKKAVEFYELAAGDAETHRAHIDRDDLRVTFTEDKQQVYESLVRLSLDYGRGAAQAHQWCERAKSRALADMLSSHTGAAATEVIQGSLPERYALVEYFVSGDEVLAFSLTKGSLIAHRRLCRLDELSDMRDWLSFQMDGLMADSAFGKHGEGRLLETANYHLSEMYGRLLGPVIGELDADHLTIVPHGIMHDLPFHAFYDGERYVLDRFTVSYAPSSSVFHYCAGKPDVSGRPLLMGFADDDAPFIEDEIRELEKISPGARTLLGADATSRAFRDEAGSSSFIHIAAHSVFRPDNPMGSAFRLADGWLSALDLYGIRCEANLVTLSGCKSGVSRAAGADEVLGLTRGLLYAGARSLLLSFWNLDDQAACAFMKAFYREWLGGETKARALRAAALEIRNVRPHPFFWAPFYLVGKP